MTARRTVAPLAYRVPNAPPAFVGRKDELTAIQAAARRGPLVVLTGAGGFGKTALASAVVHGPLSKRSARAVIVGAQAHAPFGQFLLDVVRALGRAEMRTNADLVMRVIDLAEARGSLVVLDDIHHVLPEVTTLLVAVARYARRALWIATSRVEPRAPELLGQVIRVGPLDARRLADLAQMVDRGLSRRAALRIARKSRGSPWKARVLASGEAPASRDPTSRALLATLSAMRRPISRDALAATVGDEPVGRQVNELVRRGLVEPVAGGYRLYEQARPLVRPSPADDTVAPRMVAALAAARPEDALEALRLAIERRDEAQALEVCEASFDALLRGGFAPTLWDLLAPRRGAGWTTYKLRAAMQLADVRITSLLEEPAPDALRERLMWVRALMVDSKPTEAVVAAGSLSHAASASGDERVAFWASLEHAMAVRMLSGPDQGLALVAAAIPFDDATRALHAALKAFWLAEAGRVNESIEVLERSALEARATTFDTPLAEEILGGPLDFFVRYYRMAAFMECGHLERAHEEIAAGPKETNVDDTLRASYVQLDGIANLSIARGKLDEAASTLARLLRGPPSGASMYHIIARLLDIERRISAGVFEDVDRDLDQLLGETRKTNVLIHAWCVDTRERLHIVHAIQEEPPLDHDASPLGAVASSVLTLRRALRRARWGDAKSSLPDPVDVEGAIVRELVLGTRALVRGDAATEHARHAVDLAARHGWLVRECEARQLLAEALLASGDPQDALAEAHAIAQRAATMPSPRFEADARFFAAVLEDPPLDGALLDELACADSVSPLAARRARALLEDRSVRLDAVDERVLRAARAAAPVEMFRVHAPGGARRGWGLDMRRRSVWLPNGKRVPFARYALLAHVLEVMGRHQGVASFEQLAHEVWNRKDFHPLHDGNRMRVTLHRLRALVEDDPQRPRRVVLGASSYELGPEPFTLLCASNAK